MRVSRLGNICLVIMLITVGAFVLNVAAEASSIRLSISEPSAAPEVGQVFETRVEFWTEGVVLGAYWLTINADPGVLEILEITTPADSEFYDNAFVDTASFGTGETAICGYQTERISEQTAPRTLVTIRWMVLSAPTPISQIRLVPKTLIDAFWRPTGEVYCYDRYIFGPLGQPDVRIARSGVSVVITVLNGKAGLTYQLLTGSEAGGAVDTYGSPVSQETDGAFSFPPIDISDDERRFFRVEVTQ